MTRFLAGVLGKTRWLEMRAVAVNGEPGWYSPRRHVVQVVALRVEGGVRAVDVTTNPDKLARWSVAEVG